MRIIDLYSQWCIAITDKEIKYKLRCAYPFSSHITAEYKRLEKEWHEAVILAANIEDIIISILQDRVYMLSDGEYLLVVESSLGDGTRYLERRLQYVDD